MPKFQYSQAEEQQRRVPGKSHQDPSPPRKLPRQKRDVIFGKGELTRACQTVLREATEPLTSRQIAQEVIVVNGQDARDRKYVSDLVKRVGKALRALHGNRRVRKGQDANGNVVWSRAV